MKDDFNFLIVIKILNGLYVAVLPESSATLQGLIVPNPSVIYMVRTYDKNECLCESFNWDRPPKNPAFCFLVTACFVLLMQYGFFSSRGNAGLVNKAENLTVCGHATQQCGGH